MEGQDPQEFSALKQNERERKKPATDPWELRLGKKQDMDMLLQGASHVPEALGLQGTGEEKKPSTCPDSQLHPDSSSGPGCIEGMWRGPSLLYPGDQDRTFGSGERSLPAGFAFQPRSSCSTLRKAPPPCPLSGTQAEWPGAEQRAGWMSTTPWTLTTASLGHVSKVVQLQKASRFLEGPCSPPVVSAGTV